MSNNLFTGVQPVDEHGESSGPNMLEVELQRVQQKLEKMSYKMDTLAHRVEEMMRLLIEIKNKK